MFYMGLYAGIDVYISNNLQQNTMECNYLAMPRIPCLPTVLYVSRFLIQTKFKDTFRQSHLGMFGRFITNLYSQIYISDILTWKFVFSRLYLLWCWVARGSSCSCSTVYVCRKWGVLGAGSCEPMTTTVAVVLPTNLPPPEEPHFR